MLFFFFFFKSPSLFILLLLLFFQTWELGILHHKVESGVDLQPLNDLLIVIDRRHLLGLLEILGH